MDLSTRSCRLSRAKRASAEAGRGTLRTCGKRSRFRSGLTDFGRARPGESIVAFRATQADGFCAYRCARDVDDGAIIKLALRQLPRPRSQSSTTSRTTRRFSVGPTPPSSICDRQDPAESRPADRHGEQTDPRRESGVPAGATDRRGGHPQGSWPARRRLKFQHDPSPFPEISPASHRPSSAPVR